MAQPSGSQVLNRKKLQKISIKKGAQQYNYDFISTDSLEIVLLVPGTNVPNLNKQMKYNLVLTVTYLLTG